MSECGCVVTTQMCSYKEQYFITESKRGCFSFVSCPARGLKKLALVTTCNRVEGDLNYKQLVFYSALLFTEF